MKPQKKRFNDKQLSRILSMHCAGELINYGGDVNSDEGDFVNDPGFYDGDAVCINQAAYNDPEAYTARRKLADKFDEEYESSWTPDYFLSKLEEWGA